MTTKKQFIKIIDQFQPYRFKNNNIVIDNCIILCLKCDLDYSIYYCSKTYNIIPNIYIIDDNKSENYFSYERIVENLNKMKILIIRPNPFPWDNYANAVKILKNIGIQYYHINNNFDDECTWINAATMEFDEFHKNINLLIKLYDILEDDESKKIFISAIKARLTGNIGYYSLSDYPCYYHPSVKIHDGDILIDAGIGEHISPTIQFSQDVGTSGKIFGFEPEIKHYDLAKKNLKRYKNIQLFNLGLWKELTEVSFCVSQYDDSHVDYFHKSNTFVHMIDLDYFLKQNSCKCDFIKMDIEGAELDALHGAEKTILHDKPNLAICIYHYPFSEIYTIFKYLVELKVDYKFYIGQHLPYFNDTVLYATNK